MITTQDVLRKARIVLNGRRVKNGNGNVATGSARKFSFTGVFAFCPLKAASVGLSDHYDFHYLFM